MEVKRFMKNGQEVLLVLIDGLLTSVALRKVILVMVYGMMVETGIWIFLFME